MQFRKGQKYRVQNKDIKLRRHAVDSNLKIPVQICLGKKKGLKSTKIVKASSTPHHTTSHGWSCLKTNTEEKNYLSGATKSKQLKGIDYKLPEVRANIVHSY